MRYLKGVFNTDQINLQNIVVPVDVLAKAIENSVACAVKQNIAPGMPSHISHDLHRLIGWCVNLGVYMSSDIARHVGYIAVPENDEEQKSIEYLSQLYWSYKRNKFVANYEAELRSRVGEIDCAARIEFLNAAVLQADQLAASQYPQLFELDTEFVDKDGLVDYRRLKRQFDEIQPGIFHDKARDLLLFAHPFFRRSLSRRNNLNFYFLKALAGFAGTESIENVRLRLDPDLLGHPKSARHAIELEYWRGPFFDEDISKIPNGVAEHKASERTRFYEGVDKTQFWWKATESRIVDDRKSDYRTFEAEELIENPSRGVSDETFGCRYAHAEYSMGDDTISHFDGAIRSYQGDVYLERIDQSIDRAGKKSNYTKLFRFDGAISVAVWKALCADFFRGNDLVPEYFAGRVPVEAASSVQAEMLTASADSRSVDSAEAEGACGLGVLVAFAEPSDQDAVYIVADETLRQGDQEIHCIDLPEGSASAGFLSRFAGLQQANLIKFSDRIANFPRIVLGRQATLSQDWKRAVDELVIALRADAEAGVLRCTAISVAWNSDSGLITLSVAGDVRRVIDFLASVTGAVDPQQTMVFWIKDLKSLVKLHSIDDDDRFDPTRFIDVNGLLRIPHLTGRVAELRSPAVKE